MQAKQRLVRGFIKLNSYILGEKITLYILKYLQHILPTRYAAPINWLILAEFPLNFQTELLYTYGSPREFPQIRIKVNPKCLHAKFFVMSGYYEEFLTKEILSKCRKGLLVDIGANFGYYSVLWLQKEGTRVIAVEPVTEYVELLHENLKDYQSRYVVFPGCIGDRNGTASLDTFGEPTMLSKVVSDRHQIGARQVEMLTLNSLLEKSHEQTIDVLKIDAEGYDLKILANCKALFVAKAIRTVFWETANTPEEKQMIEFLETLGYTKILDQGATGYELLSNN